MERPLLVTDGRYVFAHHLGMVFGPFVCSVTIDGQIANESANSSDENGVPFNPRECKGGRIHLVENPMFPLLAGGASATPTEELEVTGTVMQPLTKEPGHAESQ